MKQFSTYEVFAYLNSAMEDKVTFIVDAWSVEDAYDIAYSRAEEHGIHLDRYDVEITSIDKSEVS